MSVNIQPEEKKCGDKIVFGTCNHYFTQFRKYRQWDSQVTFLVNSQFTFVVKLKVLTGLGPLQVPHVVDVMS